MTDDGSPLDDDGEWVTNVPDDDQGEEAADKLEHATNLAQTWLVLPPSDGSLRRCHGVLPSD